MKIAVLGCGNMGKAIIAGLADKQGASLSLSVFDKSRKALTKLPKAAKVVAPAKWFGAKTAPDVILIAVKPQDIETALKSVLADIPKASVQSSLWLSIAAGVSIARLEVVLGAKARICRAMPNTPALIGEAVTAYALNKKCKSSDVSLTQLVLGSFGQATRVPEKMMDAITGLSGSGPAYVYLFIEALIEGGVTAGLPYDVAKQCAVQTVIGASKLVQSSPLSPAQLKSNVMSPGGTTARGLMALEKHGFKYSVIQAVTGAAQRSAELGKQ